MKKYIAKGAYYVLSLSLGMVVSLFLIKLHVNSLATIAIGGGVAGFALGVMKARKKPKDPGKG